MKHKYIGHSAELEEIKISLESAKLRNKALPHMLFSGTAGCGKTSMATEISKISGVELLSTSAESIVDLNTIRNILGKLNHDNYNKVGDRIGIIQPTIIFIDEIHGMSMIGQEHLGIAMESFRITSKTPGKEHWIPYFTLIGATTKDGALSKPLRDRFKIRFLFEPYNHTNITKIVLEHSNRLEFNITPKACRIIAQRSKGIPRIAIGYLERVRDYSISIKSNVITSTVAENLFRQIKVDIEGFTKTEIRILKKLYDSQDAISLNTLSTLVHEDPKSLERSIEPFLIQKGFISITGRGRKITENGREYIEAAGYTSSKQQKMEIPHSYERK